MSAMQRWVDDASGASLIDGAIEPKGYRPEEFRRMLRHKNPLAIEAVTAGIVLIDDGTWERYRTGAPD